MKFIEYQKRVEGTLAKRFYISSTDVEAIDHLLAEKNSCLTGAHGNSKPVVIWGEIDMSLYNKQIENKGAQPINGIMFSSAKAASRHLGYTWDAVTQALLRAKARGKTIAMVAGVPFRWADEIGGIE